MNIRLMNPHSEQLIKEHLSHGQFNSAEEVIERALETLSERVQGHASINGVRARIIFPTDEVMAS